MKLETRWSEEFCKINKDYFLQRNKKTDYSSGGRVSPRKCGIQLETCQQNWILMLHVSLKIWGYNVSHNGIQKIESSYESFHFLWQIRIITDILFVNRSSENRHFGFLFCLVENLSSVDYYVYAFILLSPLLCYERMLARALIISRSCSCYRCVTFD